MAQASNNQPQVIWLGPIKGLNDQASPAELQPQAVLTNDLLNVKARFGDLTGRGGVEIYPVVPSTPAADVVIGLMYYNRGLQSTNQLLRFLPDALEVFNVGTGVWDDVTGDPIGGLFGDRPQYSTQHGVLVYTMEGRVRPQGWGVNPGAAVNYLTSTQLGGNPPFAKAITSYMQFVLLGNVSQDGTFADMLDGWRTIIYSDDPFFSWFDCIGNSINVYQTPGKIMALKQLGRDCMIYKDDGVVRLTWVGTAVRFTLDLIPGSVGTIAPLSVADLGAFGHAYLGTDGYIYHNNGAQIRPVSMGFLEDTLPPVTGLGFLKDSRSMVLTTQDLYILFYFSAEELTGFLARYVAWNYRTGEFTKGEIGKIDFATGHAIGGVFATAAQNYYPAPDSAEVGLIGGVNITSIPTFDHDVFRFDSPTANNDGGATVEEVTVSQKVTRYWTTGWQNFAGAEGFVFGAMAVMKQDPTATIKISVARDLQEKYEHEQNFSLAGIYPMSVGGRVECHYRFPSPMVGGWFKFKVEFLHNKPNSKTTLYRFGVIARPSKSYPQSQQRMPNLQPSVGS